MKTGCENRSEPVVKRKQKKLKQKTKVTFLIILYLIKIMKFFYRNVYKRCLKNHQHLKWTLVYKNI
jgi:hypothetical protein